MINDLMWERSDFPTGNKLTDEVSQLGQNPTAIASGCG
jgi:hypothetical protein